MKIRRRTIRLTAALVLCGLGGAAHAQFDDATCFQLWRERNGIYKSAGYCFQTERARSYFGNGGCVTSNAAALPLSPGQQATIAEIVRMERLKGCN